ncbi:hypothetical protein QTO34_008508 [Cnephaeus nilssonii]|uniref:ADP-ribosyl cyclase/cyclic ADP-ribose hydrolase 1 n=1 Tax=Cnephaeus nilssonii TaxID=3371016 RepID=A0AA40IAE6_CNENI|nr:hypothetical protein QTO34_008508 [Eptesicus nilssonii]
MLHSIFHVLSHRHTDCGQIGKAFMNAFLSKDPCHSSEQDYQLLLKLTNQTTPCHTSVFWSKSNQLAHLYTRVRQDMFTLEDTLIGYIADGLYWCGDAGSSGLNAPVLVLSNEQNDDSKLVTVFLSGVWRVRFPWVSKAPGLSGKQTARLTALKELSVAVAKPIRKLILTMSQSLGIECRGIVGFLFLFQFAENACGVVQVVLNGSITNTFDKNRYWGRRVMGAGGGHHSCSSPIIDDLKFILSKRNISFTCQDDYR